MKFRYFLPFFAVFISTAFLFKAVTGFWADSEIWAVTLSKVKFFSFTAENTIPADSLGLYFKPLHHLLIKFTYILFPDSWNILTINRSVGAAIGFGIAIVYARVFYEILYDRKGFILAFIAILATTLFFERGYRIRADLLASLFHGLILLEFFHLQRKTDAFDIKISTFLLVIYELCMVLSTVKYLPVLVLLNILYFFLLAGESKEHYWVRFYKTKFLIQVFLVFAILLGIHFYTPHFLENYVQELIKYSMEADMAATGENETKFIHVFRWVSGNPLIWVGYISLVVFSLMRLFLSREKVFTFEKNKNFLTFYSILFLIYVLATPEKYSYFIASVSPIFTILSLIYLVHFIG
ncbi:MAG: hypothetical protein R2827_05995 [Bdellovibrionales bacterium]